MELYTKDQFDSKIRRFSGFIGLWMTVAALFEVTLKKSSKRFFKKPFSKNNSNNVF